jgi:hypothetical protein
MEEKQCMIESRVYAPDTEVCDEELCYVCSDGVWQQKGALDFIVRP